MGIGWTPAYRAEVLGDAAQANTTTTAAAFVIDGPAALRRLLVRPTTPETVARSFVAQLRRNAAHGLAGTAVSVFFDIAARMPPQRALVAASRARAIVAQPIHAAAIATLHLDQIGPGHQKRVMPWDDLLRVPWAKAKVWELLARAVFAALCAEEGCSVEVVSASFSHTRQCNLDFVATTPTMHGEADLNVAVRASEFAAAEIDTQIVTVDYDQVLQALVSTTPAARWLQFKAETVDTAILLPAYGGDNRAQRLNAAFFLLAAFKSDYSVALCRLTNVRVRTFLQAMTHTIPVMGESVGADGARLLTFYPLRLHCILQRCPPDTADAVARILWTLAYFAGYDSHRQPFGGPPPVVLPPDVWTHRTLVVARDVHV